MAESAIKGAITTIFKCKRLGDKITVPELHKLFYYYWLGLYCGRVQPKSSEIDAALGELMSDGIIGSDMELYLIGKNN